MVGRHGRAGHEPLHFAEGSDPLVLEEALGEAAALLNAARQPVILADVEIQRFGLQRELVRLAEHTGIPVAATILASR